MQMILGDAAVQTMWNSLVGTVSNYTFCTKSKLHIKQGNNLKRKKIYYLAILVYGSEKTEKLVCFKILQVYP